MANNKNESKKPGFFKKVKEVFSELKRVTWPTFPKILKGTATVLGIVLIFLVLMAGINQLLQFLLNLLTSIGG
ncbi:MAG: preprotein translocase subunit SecE [Clostridia bacterium]|nr:preprotein translocase subunit SecE [Clostridia bacterium]